uniref:Uncharacterized protein n=1 Tax=Mesocestoides corti TaxID=53468 RepID=A0A5K3FAX7_MESCO
MTTTNSPTACGQSIVLPVDVVCRRRSRRCSLHISQANLTAISCRQSMCVCARVSATARLVITTTTAFRTATISSSPSALWEAWKGGISLGQVTRLTLAGGVPSFLPPNPQPPPPTARAAKRFRSNELHMSTHIIVRVFVLMKHFDSFEFLV